MHSTLDLPGLVDQVFDAYPAPTLVVDDDVRVLMLNKAARIMLGVDPDAAPVLLKRGGEILHCIQAAGPHGGCGKEPACKTCTVRESVGRALRSDAVQRAKVHMQLRAGAGTVEAYFLVSASPLRHQGGTYVVVTLEDVSDLVQLKSLLPICSGCRKIRDDEDYWRTIEDYMKSSLDVDFSHGLCESCLERLYPAPVEIGPTEA